MESYDGRSRSVRESATGLLQSTPARGAGCYAHVDMVVSTTPAAMRVTPRSRDGFSASWNVIADIRSPRLGTASRVTEIVVARRWRPTSTTAQYANPVANGPT